MESSTRLARVLEHPVAATLEPAGAGWVAVSLAGDPPHVRVAWVELPSGAIRARVACPPRVPSRWRPLVASEVTLEDADGPLDRLLVGRADTTVRAVAPLLAIEDPLPATPVGPDGLVVLRLPPDAVLLGADAIGPADEPVGRLERVGIADLHTSGGAVSGRLGAGHGMAAGIGDGHWAADLADAAFEAGYELLLPEWVPEDLEMSAPRVEPDAAYPAAPPAIIVPWVGDRYRRVLVRQAVAPLASPDPGGRGSTPIEVNGAPAVLRGRGEFMTLVWQTPERAFGVQVRSMPDAREVAVRVAESIPVPGA